MNPARVASALWTLLVMSQALPAGDVTWSGTVTVDQDLDVEEGTTLRIEPGTTVEIGPSVTIRVFGALRAEGTEAEPIRFTRQTAGTRWERLFFIEAADSLLSHCVIEFSDCEGDHKDYYDDKDADCNPVTERPPRDYNESVVVLASHVDMDSCTFQNLPDDGASGEGDAIAVISDDPEHPGEATATITNCQFLSIGQGVHTRYSYVLVEDCFFTDHHGDNDDVDLYGESAEPSLIHNNLFLDPSHDDMINPTRCSAVLVGNIIAGSDDHGIVLRDRCDPVVFNNVIYDCSSAGIAVQNTCDALLVNNTIVDCGRGVRFFDHDGRWGLPYCLTPGSGRATLINCAIWNCPTTFELRNSPYEPEPGSHVTISHCDVQGGDSRMSVSSDSTVTWGEGNIDADPLFVDAPNGDFRLQEDSPLIDAGSAEQAPVTDIDGNPRPSCDGVDIGATEYVDCGPPEPQFRRGDVNADAILDVSDPVRLLFGLFLQQTLTCEKSADADDSGELELTDALIVLNFLFLDGPPPAAPGLVCGSDPTADSRTCDAYDACP